MFTRKQKIKIFLEMTLFVLLFPIIWIVENENTKVGKTITFVIQIVVSVITTIVMCNYLK